MGKRLAATHETRPRPATRHAVAVVILSALFGVACPGAEVPADGGVDAGTVDAGTVDAGTVDAGRDGGADAGSDAGTDAGCLAAGALCQNDSDCCWGGCFGQCACSTAGDVCNVDHDCCGGGPCVQGACPCLGPGAACRTNWNCCSNFCSPDSGQCS